MISIWSIVLIVIGLCVFEIISSVNNAIVNAEVLATMHKRARRWFLIWGLLFAVFVIRGLLPWAIVWVTNPELGPWKAFTSTLTNNPQILQSIEHSAPVLLMGGGVFLLFLFLNWVFMEEKKVGVVSKHFFFNNRFCFFTSVLVILILVAIFTISKDSRITIGALVGAVIFFIARGFKQHAENTHKNLASKNISDISKIIYLEFLDASFSMDGVLGAFAFTLSVPLILIGNGLGALVVRQFTVKNIKSIKKYIYLDNGAMYSIFFLGMIMVLDSFGVNSPSWLPPVLTFVVVGYFLLKSWKHPKKDGRKKKK